MQRGGLLLNGLISYSYNKNLAECMGRGRDAGGFFDAYRALAGTVRRPTRDEIACAQRQTYGTSCTVM